MRVYILAGCEGIYFSMVLGGHRPAWILSKVSPFGIPFPLDLPSTSDADAFITGDALSTKLP